MLNFVCALRELIYAFAAFTILTEANWRMAADSELNEISEEKWTAKGDVSSLVKSFGSFAQVWQDLLARVVCLSSARVMY